MWITLKKQIMNNEESLIVTTDKKATFKEYLEMAENTGNMLKNNMKSRAKCAILCESGFNTGRAILSCWAAGMIPIPMSVRYGEKHCRNIIELTKPDLIITDESPDWVNEHDICQYNLKDNVFVNEIPLIDEEKELCDVAAILCTSGTTGKPKGVMITESGLLENIYGISDYFEIGNTDNMLIARPLYHCAVLTGEFLTALFKGCNIIFYEEDFSPLRIPAYIEKYNITVLCGTPTIFYHLAQYYMRRKTISALHTAVISGECLYSSVAKIIRASFPETDIYNVYGLTECSPRVCYLAPMYFDAYPEAVGGGLKNTEIKVVDGNIFVKSPSIMKGYYKNPKLTREVLIGDWLKTGDIGYKNRNGLIFIHGRADNMIIKAGMNIYPKEIENKLMTSEMIDEVMAYPIIGKTGADIGIKLVLNPLYRDITKKQLVEAVCKLLPSYMVPLDISIIDRIVQSGSGKIIREAG